MVGPRKRTQLLEHGRRLSRRARRGRGRLRTRGQKRGEHIGRGRSAYARSPRTSFGTHLIDLVDTATRAIVEIVVGAIELRSAGACLIRRRVRGTERGGADAGGICCGCGCTGSGCGVGCGLMALRMALEMGEGSQSGIRNARSVGAYFHTSVAVQCRRGTACPRSFVALDMDVRIISRKVCDLHAECGVRLLHSKDLLQHPVDTLPVRGDIGRKSILMA